MIDEEIVNNGNKAYRREVLDGGKANIFVVGYATCAYEYEKRIAELEARLRKMQCCGNCVHFDFTEPNYCHKGVYRANQYVCDKWYFGN